LKFHITADHRLDGTVPDDVTLGEAKVVVLYENDSHSDENQMNKMFSFLDDIQKKNHPRRSLDEIKAYIDGERDSWDD